MPAPSASTAPPISLCASLSSRSKRACPDAARQPCPPVLLHQVEQIGLGSLGDLAPCAALHRASAGVGLEAALAAALAPSPSELDDGVADLAGRAATQPALAADDDRAADARPPPDAEEGAVVLAGAELRLRVDGDADVVGHADRHADLLAQRRGERKASVPVGEVARVRDAPVLDLAGRADADAAQLGRLDAGRLGCVLQSTRQRLDHGGRAALVRCRPARLADDGAVWIDDDRFDLRAAQVDSAAESHGEKPIPVWTRGHGVLDPREREVGSARVLVVCEQRADELVEGRAVTTRDDRGRERAHGRRARDVHRERDLAEVVPGAQDGARPRP